MAFLDYSGLSHFLDKIKALFPVKADAIKNITRSGTTFTATRADNTTFTFTQQDSDTKNTAGTTNKTGTKMFIAAATEQSANPQTYSNSNVYIGTDNCLYSGGTKVLTSHQDISGKVSGPSSATNNAVAIFDGTGGKTIKNSGFTIGKSVPSDAKFTDTTYSQISRGSSAGLAPGLPSGSGTTKYLREDGSWQVPPDTNTWRPVQDNLTSTSTTDCLSANQGKVLNDNIKYISLGSFSSVTELQTYIEAHKSSYAESIPNAINFYMTASSGVFSGSYTYFGHLFKVNDNSINIVVTEGNSLRTIRGNYNTGTFSWDELALNSNINTTKRDISASDSIKDCNNAEIGKCYNVYGSALHTPFPNTVSSLFTYGNGQIKRQFISNGYNMYLRSFANNTWSDWVQLALNSKIENRDYTTGTMVDISDRGNTYPYQTPTNGYVRVAKNGAQIFIGSGGALLFTATSDSEVSVYVPKGTYVSTMGNGGTTRFIPLY